MRRDEQLLALVTPLAADDAAAQCYARHLDELLSLLSREQLDPAYGQAMDKGDYPEAVRICAAHFRAKPDFAPPELSANGSYSPQEAENCINGHARVINIDWQFPDGEVDFLFDPTEIKGPRNHEWLWQFNRHGQWVDLARAYRAQGDERCAAAFRRQLLKWIAQTFIPERWNARGSAWRTIECGIRLLGSWMVAFDGFKTSATLEDAALLLMIASMHRQAVHLVEHPTTRNWLMMESNGLYTFSALFPELSDAADHRKLAADRLLAELAGQILPDGMHNELSPDYQGVVFFCAANFYSLAQALGRLDEIPPDFAELMHRTVHAAIRLSTPAFTQPRTNDTYTIPTARFTDRAAALLGDRPEYRFVNTNRREGTPPAGVTPSVLLPYAGFAVMRSDWGADATYLCFDVGPLGCAHYHQDKLNINIYKGSQELIYDDGGGQYEISAAREYAISGYAHNTVLVDGLAQYRKAPLENREPADAVWITTPTFDYAAAVYDDTYGSELARPATHRREIRFCRPDFFCVTDTLTSADGCPHDYELLFHLDTTQAEQLAAYPGGVLSAYGKPWEIALLPLDDALDLRIVSAQLEPQMRGWYHGRNEADLHASTTVSRRICGVREHRFHTLLIPLRSGEALPRIVRHDSGQITVLVHDREHTFTLDCPDQPRCNITPKTE